MHFWLKNFFRLHFYINYNIEFILEREFSFFFKKNDNDFSGFQTQCFVLALSASVIRSQETWHSSPRGYKFAVKPTINHPSSSWCWMHIWDNVAEKYSKWFWKLYVLHLCDLSGYGNRFTNSATPPWFLWKIPKMPILRSSYQPYLTLQVAYWNVSNDK